MYGTVGITEEWDVRGDLPGPSLTRPPPDANSMLFLCPAPFLSAVDMSILNCDYMCGECFYSQATRKGRMNEGK